MSTPADCGCASGQDGSVPATTALLLTVLGLMMRRPRAQPARRVKR